jgi:hypothetical protein
LGNKFWKEAQKYSDDQLGLFEVWGNNFIIFQNRMD